MERISPLQPGGVPEPAVPITSPSKSQSPVPAVAGDGTADRPAVQVESTASQVAVPPEARSPQELAALSAAVASGQYPIDPAAIAKAILAAFTGGNS
jgi:anti-sigma28 factor (negative regulator of flagellin synthesis)